MVSICIPVYNGELYIYKTLNSALNQTYKNIEIIIFDDCSTDNSAEIIKTFDDCRITYHLNDKNYGAFLNFQKCIEACNGEFIKLLNHDDLLRPNAIEKQVNVLINNPDVSLCITATNVINEFDKIIMKRQLYKKSLKINGKRLAKKTLLYGRNIYGEPSTVLFRKDKSRLIGNFNKELYISNDLDYWIRLSYVGDVYYINEFLSDWRLSQTNDTSRLFFKKFKLLFIDWNILLKKHSKLNIIKLNTFDIFISKTLFIIMIIIKLFFIKIEIRKNKIK